MTQSLKVIALISGGKDSFFSLLHCLHNNYHVIAIANLCPAAASEISDLNSYMYQTVGHTLIPLYAEALELPLYRRQISGSVVNSQKDYYPVNLASNEISYNSTSADGEDEIGSLFGLLEEVKAAHPAANAVSSGTILSTYQRTRIESVALRLGLTPLSYLWQYPSLPTPIPRPGGLLEDIAAVGLDARIIKVASGGLDEALLWGSIRDKKVRHKLEKDMARFGGSVLGEGGEYETLVISGPSPVWKRNLEIVEAARETVQAEGGEYWVAFKGGSLSGPIATESAEQWRHDLKVPSLWDGVFAKLSKCGDVLASIAYEREEDGTSEHTLPYCWTAVESVTQQSNSLSISNIIASSNEADVRGQMTSIKETLNRILQSHRTSAEHVVFTTLLLRSMEDFTAINNIYATLFTMPNPPARVTVACGDALPLGVHVVASFIVDLGPSYGRDGLHVQSRSYWAPANIGPYSQAISVPVSGIEEDGSKEAQLVYIAGQIPLVPGSMEVLPRDDHRGCDKLNPDLLAFWQQTCLSLQHLWRIGKSTGVTWWANSIAFISGKDHIKAKATLASQAWKMLHERGLWRGENMDEDGFLDIWDRKYGGQGTFALEREDPHLPDFDKLPPGFDMKQALPGFLAVQVDELPRGCSVEWQGLGAVLDEMPNFTRSSTEKTMYISLKVHRKRFLSTICIPATASGSDILNHPAWVSYIADPANDCSHSTFYTPQPHVFSTATRAQIVPCRSVWGRDGLKLAAGIVRHVDLAYEAAL